MRTIMKAAISVAALAADFAAAPVSAQADPADAAPPTPAAQRIGIRAGDVLLRARAIVVIPNERSGSILPAFLGEKVKIDDSAMPELDATWMATDNLGFELIASTTKHDASGRSGTTGGIGKLASTWVLPPTLTAQYHFLPTGHVRPYVGAGINYTVFWNEKASAGLVKAVGPTHVHMNDSFSWAAQTGMDVDLTRRVFLNLDVKYIDMDTTARLRTAAAGTQRVHIDIDPIVVGVGFGIRL